MDADTEPLSFDGCLSSGGDAVRVIALSSQVLPETRAPFQATAAQSRDVALSCHVGLEYGQPAVVDFALDRVCVALHDAHDIHDDLVLCALYQTVVALVASTSFAQRAGTYCPELPEDGVCFGFGIVRSIAADGAVVTVQCNAAVASRAHLINVIARAAHALVREKIV